MASYTVTKTVSGGRIQIPVTTQGTSTAVSPPTMVQELSASSRAVQPRISSVSITITQITYQPSSGFSLAETYLDVGTGNSSSFTATQTFSPVTAAAGQSVSGFSTLPAIRIRGRARPNGSQIVSAVQIYITYTLTIVCQFDYPVAGDSISASVLNTYFRMTGSNDVGVYNGTSLANATGLIIYPSLVGGSYPNTIQPLHYYLPPNTANKSDHWNTSGTIITASEYYNALVSWAAQAWHAWAAT